MNNQEQDNASFLAMLICAFYAILIFIAALSERQPWIDFGIFLILLICFHKLLKSIRKNYP